MGTGGGPLPGEWRGERLEIGGGFSLGIRKGGGDCSKGGKNSTIVGKVKLKDTP